MKEMFLLKSGKRNFEIRTQEWRGIGEIPNSGLVMKKVQDFDTSKEI